MIELPLSARGDEPDALFAKPCASVYLHVKVPCVGRKLRTLRSQPTGTRTRLQAWLGLMVRGDSLTRVSSMHLHTQVQLK
jgi:hypothetical protein